MAFRIQASEPWPPLCFLPPGGAKWRGRERECVAVSVVWVLIKSRDASIKGSGTRDRHTPFLLPPSRPMPCAGPLPVALCPVGYLTLYIQSPAA